MLVASNTTKSDKFSLDTGWVRSKHIAGVTTQHYQNTALPVDKVLVFTMDFQNLDVNSLGPVSYINISLGSSAGTINMTNFLFGFDNRSKVYGGTASGSSGYIPNYNSIHRVTRDTNYHLPDGSVGTLAYIGDSPSFSFSTMSNLNLNIKFAYRIRIIEEDAVAEVYA